MRDTGKTTRQVPTDTELPDMTRSIRYEVSCERPRDLMGRMPNDRQVCARCGKPEPVEDFGGGIRCSRCRAKAAEQQARHRERNRQ